MEATRLCPYCLQPLPGAAQSCPHCGKSFAGRNPGGTLPVGTVLAGRYTVGEMLSIDGEGILYRGAENLGRFRVTIKEYLPITLTAERTAESTLRPKTGSEVLFKTTRMDFADLYRSIQRITPANGLEAVLDVVEANNSVYAILENLGGTPLDQWLENHPGTIRPDDACTMLQACTNSCTKAIPPRSSIPPQSSRAAIPMNTALRQCSTAWCAGRPRCLRRSALWQTPTHAQNR